MSNASATLHSSNTSDLQFMETQSSASALQLTQTQSSTIVLNTSQDSMASHLDNGNSPSYCMEVANSTLKIKEFKRFQVHCISAITQRKDVVVVQPTGSGKFLCFVLPAIPYPGKVSLVIEPVVAVITNQVDALQKKGIIVLALGRAAGTKNQLTTDVFLVSY